MLFFPHRRLEIGLKCDESKFPGEVASVLEVFLSSVSDYVCSLYNISFNAPF